MYKYLTGIDIIDERSGGVNPGTNILILAPSFTDGERVTALIAKPRQNEYTIVLTTENQASDLLNYYVSEGFDGDHVGFIDAITKSTLSSLTDTQKIKYVGSPNDLTGMDIKFSQLSEEIMKGAFTNDPNQLFPTPIRYSIISITSLLMFRKIDVVYQFLHVATSKIKKMGSIGVFLLNSESFDTKTVAVLKQLMNIVVEIRSDEKGNAMRIQGSFGLSNNWRIFTIEESNIVFSS